VGSQIGGHKTEFFVRSATTIATVVDFYCSKQRLVKESFRIMIDGKRVNLAHTVGELEMEEGDTYAPFPLPNSLYVALVVNCIIAHLSCLSVFRCASVHCHTHYVVHANTAFPSTLHCTTCSHITLTMYASQRMTCDHVLKQHRFLHHAVWRLATSCMVSSNTYR